MSARRIAPRIRIPRSYLLSAILVFCVAGSHAINTSFIDVRTMLGFGVVGLARESARVPLGPFVIGVGLTPIAEVQLRAAMMMSGDDPSAILTRPFAMGFLTLALLTLAWPGLAARRARRNIANQTE
ncbi:tripartite tricarboxylate transporter permease [Salipiger aestuarii]|uniref:tripartite tricarboxylate transporter permease n=1 Tax=Salipiger aestuarii TaxID=568098 RepID=UPI001238FFB3|nr:tripartite tricarboxylate transporter permease [Salipiger aestuarii]KAA8607192.1 hypothetical protein AL037_19260 [Salipiger aestuarii]